MRSNITWFCIWYDNDWSKRCIRGYIHKDTPYLALTGKLWGVCEDLWKLILITALHCILGSIGMKAFINFYKKTPWWIWWADKPTWLHSTLKIPTLSRDSKRPINLISLSPTGIYCIVLKTTESFFLKHQRKPWLGCLCQLCEKLFQILWMISIDMSHTQNQLCMMQTRNSLWLLTPTQLGPNNIYCKRYGIYTEMPKMQQVVHGEWGHTISRKLETVSYGVW